MNIIKMNKIFMFLFNFKEFVFNLGIEEKFLYGCEAGKRSMRVFRFG